MNNPKEKIRDLVGKAELKEALQVFYIALSEGGNVSKNDITQLNSQLAHLEEEENKGIISHSEKTLETNKIANRILSLLNTWNQGGEMSNLDKILYGLNIDKNADLGLLQMVNSDRIIPIRKFKRSFEDKKQADFTLQISILWENR